MYYVALVPNESALKINSRVEAKAAFKKKGDGLPVCLRSRELGAIQSKRVVGQFPDGGRRIQSD